MSPVKVINHNAVPYVETHDTFQFPDAVRWGVTNGVLAVIDAHGKTVSSFAQGSWSHVTHETTGPVVS